jgi:hypothetical protein
MVDNKSEYGLVSMSKIHLTIILIVALRGRSTAHEIALHLIVAQRGGSTTLEVAVHLIVAQRGRSTTHEIAEATTSALIVLDLRTFTEG